MQTFFESWDCCELSKKLHPYNYLEEDRCPHYLGEKSKFPFAGSVGTILCARCESPNIIEDYIKCGSCGSKSFEYRFSTNRSKFLFSIDCAKCGSTIVENEEYECELCGFEFFDYVIKYNNYNRYRLKCSNCNSPVDKHMRYCLKCGCQDFDVDDFGVSKEDMMKILKSFKSE